MFPGKVIHEESGMVFRASDPNDLAAKIEQLMNDTNLYETISRNTPAAWEKLQLPVTWGDLITRFLGGAKANQEWASAMRLV